MNKLINLFSSFFTERNYKYLDPVKIHKPLSKDLLFVNSGISSILPFFTGEETSKYDKLYSIQECIRLNENPDRTHLSLFTMLGHFCISDISNIKEIFLKEAIEFLLSLGLKEEKMLITVNNQDNELLEKWKVITKKAKIQTLETNTWFLGDIGGFNTEIFYEYKGEYEEIWNLVFIKSNAYAFCKSKNKTMLDAGMGLERLFKIVNNKDSVFDIYETKYNIILIDNSRIINKLISEGLVFPSNKNKGYIVRKLIRQIIQLENKKIINIKDIKDTFTDKSFEVYKIELEKFKKMINQIEKIIKMSFYNKNQMLTHSVNIISDKELRYIYDTYGIPKEFIIDYINQKK